MSRFRLMIVLLATTASASLAADAPAKSTKKVLVELYTSQGCNSCPSANDFLGELASLGYGPDKIVPIAFHVDYFNEPWVDPFSSRDYSRRELAYNEVQKRNDLYFTPMMMVDGRSPMLGSDRPKAFAALRKSLASKPGVALELKLDRSSADRTLEATVSAPAAEAVGRKLMVGVAVTEGPIATRVPSGENAGRTLVEPFVTRSFAYQSVTLEANGSKSLRFPIKLASDSVAPRCRVAAFVQDWENGKIHQADSLPWSAKEGEVR
jgi:hypothetical protein